MPRDLFGDVIDPSITVGTRKWYSVPLSFVAHTLAIGVLVVAPLVATGALPMPSRRAAVVLLEPPRLPDPPPVRRTTPPPPPVDRNAAPVVAPDAITAEADLPPLIESTGAEFGLADVAAIEGTEVIAPPPAPKRETPPDMPVCVGGAVRPPQRVRSVAPVYPTVARAARVHGLVIIEATIDVEGRVQDARVLRSNSTLLNEPALAAVRQWTYTPTLLNGVPVSVVMTVTVHFQLR
jgi:protein TonB